MAVLLVMDLISSHKYIKNTQWNGAVLIEHLPKPAEVLKQKTRQMKDRVKRGKSRVGEAFHSLPGEIAHAESLR